MAVTPEPAWGLPDPPDLVGRSSELQLLAALVGRGGDRGGAFVVVGEPGIGKSALLVVAERRARDAGILVLTVAGVESEAQLPLAALHLLLRPVLDRLADLRSAERDALLTAFGLGEGPRPGTHLIAQATLSLLRAAAGDQPVLVLADDLHWLDPQTHQALTYAARHAARGPARRPARDADGHALVIVGALRTGYSGPFLAAGFPALEMGGIEDAAARDLLQSHASDLGSAARRQILAEARGNPLALLELPRLWRGPAAPTAGLRPPDLTHRLEQAFAARITELSAPARSALLVAAVDSADTSREIFEAASVMAGRRLGAADLAEACAVGLVGVDEGRVRFRHPLVRSGVLSSETSGRHRTAHAALAAVLADEAYRSTWHRAMSIAGRDDEAADALQFNVAVALERGAVIDAIRALERSAQLTRDSARRGHRYLLAAEHASHLGRSDMVDHFIQATSRTELSALDRVRREWLREILEYVPGDTARVLELCDNARRAVEAGERDLALNLLVGAALRCWWGDAGAVARARVVEVARGLAPTDDARYPTVLGIAEPLLQAGAVRKLLARPAPEGDADALRRLGMAAYAVGDPVRAADLLDPAEVLIRQQGRLGLLSHVLSVLANVRLELGDWRRAADAAEEGLRLAEETGQSIWRIGTLVCDARAHALRGETRRALQLAEEAESEAGRRQLNDLLSCARLARGLAWLSEGRSDLAYQELRRMFDPADPGFHHRERFSGVMFLAEAALRTDRREDARGVVQDLEQVLRATPSPVLRVHLLYARAVLAEDRDAEALFLAALNENLVRWPWPRARIKLAYGMWLRRRGRPTARGMLHSASRALKDIGARAWAEQASAQHRATVYPRGVIEKGD
ncbi:AAA family ATPase [Streptomyces sp. NBC_01136]|uniref:AAA family ATPase n=1 Tax=unclassified Streptomyces TaxID=2593676 RepID=UPI0032431C6C|nr:AAA family ATPase [Streptomyces sp. NBC_01136]